MHGELSTSRALFLLLIGGNFKKFPRYPFKLFVYRGNEPLVFAMDL